MTRAYSPLSEASTIGNIFRLSLEYSRVRFAGLLWPKHPGQVRPSRPSLGKSAHEELDDRSADRAKRRCRDFPAWMGPALTAPPLREPQLLRGGEPLG